MTMKKNVIVGQSGGPTAVINASLYGVVYEALNREDSFGTVYGMINGIEFQGEMQELFRKVLLQRGLHGKLLQVPQYHPRYLRCKLRDGAEARGVCDYDKGCIGR